MESTTGYTFTPCVGYFASTGIDTRWKGPTACSNSSERHRQCGVHELAQVSSGALTTELPRPTTDTQSLLLWVVVSQVFAHNITCLCLFCMHYCNVLNVVFPFRLKVIIHLANHRRNLHGGEQEQ